MESWIIWIAITLTVGGSLHDQPSETNSGNLDKDVENGSPGQHSGSWEDLDKYFTISPNAQSKSQNAQGNSNNMPWIDSDLYLTDMESDRDTRTNSILDLELGMNPNIEVSIEILHDTNDGPYIDTNEESSRTGNGDNSYAVETVDTSRDSSTQIIKNVLPTRTYQNPGLDLDRTSIDQGLDRTYPKLTNQNAGNFDNDLPSSSGIDEGAEFDDNDGSGSGQQDDDDYDININAESPRYDQYKAFLNPEINNCADWMNCQNKFLEKYMSNLQSLPSCPCSYPQSLQQSNSRLWDRNKRHFYEWTDASGENEVLPVYRRGASYCIRSKLIPGRMTFVAQNCCYDNQMRLITRGPGAGTPDLVSPEISRALHYKVDKLPWIICKGDWTRYNRARPPNNMRQCAENPDDATFYQLVKNAREYK